MENENTEIDISPPTAILENVVDKTTMEEENDIPTENKPTETLEYRIDETSKQNETLKLLQEEIEKIKQELEKNKVESEKKPAATPKKKTSSTTKRRKVKLEEIPKKQIKLVKQLDNQHKRRVLVNRLPTRFVQEEEEYEDEGYDYNDYIYHPPPPPVQHIPKLHHKFQQPTTNNLRMKPVHMFR